MTFLTDLHASLESFHLLKHPFYQAWNEGSLKHETLQIYASEYYHHVSAFPRYISQIHTLCPSIQARQVLLENLIDEEKGNDNHPELWLRFAEGIGISRISIPNNPALESTHQLVEGYFKLVRTDYPTGLGSLYAYERQTPEIAKAKIEGLKKHYEINDKRTLQFFFIHQTSDEWHSEALGKLMENFTEDYKQKVFGGAVKAAQLLWYFLDGIKDCHVSRL